MGNGRKREKGKTSGRKRERKRQRVDGKRFKSGNRSGVEVRGRNVLGEGREDPEEMEKRKEAERGIGREREARGVNARTVGVA